MSNIPPRNKAIQRIKQKIQRMYWLRWHMFLITLLTAVAGFFFSALLHYFGMTQLWLRYGLGVSFAYAVFLLLLRCWLSCRNWNEGSIDGADSDGECESSEPSGGSSGGWNIVDFDAGDAFIIILIAIVAVFAIGYTFYFIWEAPALLAELLLDIGFAGGLYKGLKAVEGGGWMQTALRLTYKPFLIAAAAFIIMGATMQAYYPQATTLGQVLYEMRHK